MDRRAPAIATLLSRESRAFDELLARVQGGIRDQADYDRLEAEAQAIAAGIRAAFRGGAA